MTLKFGVVDFWGIPLAILNAEKEFGIAILCFCIALEWE